MKVAALIVAAGASSRFGGATPKVYETLGGTPVLQYALAAFATHPAISDIQVVIRPEDQSLYQAAAHSYLDELMPPVTGGDSRQESVRRGLEALGPHAPDVVLIHDAARPWLPHEVIDRLLAEFDPDANTKAVIPALPVVDTLKKAQASTIVSTVDRAHLYRAQTPQAFDYLAILAAHEEGVNLPVTDDASLFEHLNIPVKIVEGDDRNLKITRPEDIQILEATMKPHPQIRTGLGYDVHGFTAQNKKDDHVMLGGIKIPHTKTFDAHSDGDVVLHALCDALLGAACLGEGKADIGQLFPPSDERYKDMESARFVEAVHTLITNAGATINNVDVIIIAEAPKIAPHTTAMRARIAQLLSIDVSRVSVKATTSEGLGFTGREEGIAAQAIATISV